MAQLLYTNEPLFAVLVGGLFALTFNYLSFSRKLREPTQQTQPLGQLRNTRLLSIVFLAMGIVLAILWLLAEFSVRGTLIDGWTFAFVISTIVATILFAITFFFTRKLSERMQRKR